MYLISLAVNNHVMSKVDGMYECSIYRKQVLTDKKTSWLSETSDIVENIQRTRPNWYVRYTLAHCLHR